MINISVPASPIPLPDWESPIDNDLIFISLASYRYCQIMDALSSGNYEIRQVTQTDVDSAGNALTSTMNSILDTLYPGGV